MRSSALRTEYGARLARLVLACALLSATPAPRAIDAAKSNAQFSVAHIWVERVTGTVSILSGGVSLEPGAVIPQSATAVLDATHITTGEPDRDRSLESPDFFDSAKFPRWTFTSTRIVPTGPASFEMDGDLAIHGDTQPQRLDVMVIGDPAHPEYRAKGQVDRHAFGMVRTRLDPTIGNIVDIRLDIVLK
ncbi:MAG: YceI family protein [Candidatus Cybelea sp.]